MERHLISEMIDGFEIYLNHQELAMFSRDFYTYYNIIDKMRVKGLPVDKDQVFLYAMIENIEIDKEYPRKNDKIPIDRLEDTIRLYLKGKEQESEYERMGRLVNEAKGGSRKSLEELQRLVSIKTTQEENYGVVDLRDITQNQVDFIDRIKNKVPLDGMYLYKPQHTRQFVKLSYQLKIIEATDLVVIAGRPSVGKTSFALSLANALSKNGYHGLFFSLEMANEQLMHRMALAKSGISNNVIFDPKGITDDVYSHYMIALDKVARTRLKVIDNPPRDWLRIKDLIIKYRDSIDYVVIDHLNYISSFSGEVVQSFHMLITKVTSDMKQLAKELKIPIILLAQFSRSLGQFTRKDDRYIEPYMRDLRESGSIEQDADKVLLLYRKDEPDKEVYERYGRFKVICKIEKNRQGSIGEVEYMFQANLGRWSEIQEDREDDDK